MNCLPRTNRMVDEKGPWGGMERGVCGVEQVFLSENDM